MRTNDCSINGTRVGVENTLEVHVGVEAVKPIEVTSTLGLGPEGAQGPQGVQGPQGPKGDQGDVGPMGGGVVAVIVPADEWPPAAPVQGVLYLKGP